MTALKSFQQASHPVPPAGGDGWGEWQVTCYPSISLSTPIYFARWPISTPGGGMSMWLLPFLWRTITGRCWPGVLKLPSIEESGFWGGAMLKFLKKILFQRNSCYHAVGESSRLREWHLWGILIEARRSTKPFFVCGNVASA